MYSVISTSDSFEQIKQVIGEEIIFEKSGDFEAEEISTVLQEASRFFSSDLIIELDCAPSEEIVTAIRNYRIARPQTRIIVIAQGRKPGDKYIAALVKMGIYDIIAPIIDTSSKNDEEILLLPFIVEFLEKEPATYADAVRWDIIINEHIISENKSTKDKLLNVIKDKKEISKENKVVNEPTILFRDRIVGTVIIAVAGASRGVGCTHTCISVANFIAKNKHSVAVYEMNDNKHLLQIYNKDYEFKDGKLENSFSLDGVDYYPNNSQTFLEVLNAAYKYIVVDLSTIRYMNEKGGIEVNDNFIEMQRANKQILVGGIKEWQLNDLRVSIGGEETAKWNFYITFSDKNMFNEFYKEIDRNIYFAPYCPDPFSEYIEQNETMEELLKDILPIENKLKRKSIFNFFK